MAAPGVVAGVIPAYVKDKATGQWFQLLGGASPGANGIDGPTGPTGPASTVSEIVGEFGNVATPAQLPVNGLIPVNFDGTGIPATAYQMVVNQGLYFNKPGDPLHGHLFQYVGTTVSDIGWVDLFLIQGPSGPIGEIGPTGPVGPMGDLTIATGDARYLKLTGGTVGGSVTLQGGDLSISSSGQGITFVGGARITSMSGGPVRLMENSVGAQPQISDASFQNSRDIVDTVSGDARYAPLVMADDVSALRAEVDRLTTEVADLRSRLL